jgi:hypothetical protein
VPPLHRTTRRFELRGVILTVAFSAKYRGLETSKTFASGETPRLSPLIVQILTDVHAFPAVLLDNMMILIRRRIAFASCVGLGSVAPDRRLNLCNNDNTSVLAFDGATAESACFQSKAHSVLRYCYKIIMVLCN